MPLPPVKPFSGGSKLDAPDFGSLDQSKRLDQERSATQEAGVQNATIRGMQRQFRQMLRGGDIHGATQLFTMMDKSHINPYGGGGISNALAQQEENVNTAANLNDVNNRIRGVVAGPADPTSKPNTAAPTANAADSTAIEGAADKANQGKTDQEQITEAANNIHSTSKPAVHYPNKDTQNPAPKPADNPADVAREALAESDPLKNSNSLESKRSRMAELTKKFRQEDELRNPSNEITQEERNKYERSSANVEVDNKIDQSIKNLDPSKFSPEQKAQIQKMMSGLSDKDRADSIEQAAQLTRERTHREIDKMLGNSPEKPKSNSTETAKTAEPPAASPAPASPPTAESQRDAWAEIDRQVANLPKQTPVASPPYVPATSPVVADKPAPTAPVAQAQVQKNDSPMEEWTQGLPESNIREIRKRAAEGHDPVREAKKLKDNLANGRYERTEDGIVPSNPIANFFKNVMGSIEARDQEIERRQEAYRRDMDARNSKANANSIAQLLQPSL